MRVLVVGSGGREHALAATLERGGHEVHVAPGNGGVDPGRCHPAVAATDPAALSALAVALPADLVVVGPEAALVAGVADACRAAGVPVFGPSAAAARLEASKSYAKEVMAAAGVPTAASRTCTTPFEVAAALDAFGPPYVVKDDGLAAGKGVLVTKDRSAALAHAAAYGRVVVEEYLDGPEVSLFAVTDGVDAVPLLPAQDFKRVGESDTGPNTGGMGAYCPLPWLPRDLGARVVERIVRPVLREMAGRGTPFAGLLYVGLAMTRQGPRVVEFNARFGDPETQAVLPLLASDLGALLLAAATGRLAAEPAPRWRDAAAVTVVLASPGYPGTPQLGGVVGGLAAAAAVPGALVFHAGTARAADGTVTASGGRVLDVTGVGDDLADARAAAYEALGRIDLPGGLRRSDIALRAVRGEIPVPPGFPPPA